MDIGNVLQTLLFHGPMALVGLFGVVFSLVKISRLGSAAVLALIGSGLLVLTSAAFVVQQFLMMQIRVDGNSGAMSLYTVIGLAASLIRVLAIGLMLAAVFAGRPREPLPFD